MSFTDESRRSGPSWTFFTNHAHVLFLIASQPDILIRDLAPLVGITERAVQRIIAELIDAGYLVAHRQGRRNHYQVHRQLPLRHPLEAHRRIEDLICVLTEDMAADSPGSDEAEWSATVSQRGTPRKNRRKQ